MLGLMQDSPLLISGLLSHAAAAHGKRPIVSRLVDEPLWRYDYAGLAARTARAAHLLRSMGVAPGDRISSLGWNTHRHMELMFAAPGIGAVLHTANPRLTDEQIAYTIEHAGSSILFYERTFADLKQRIAETLAVLAEADPFAMNAAADKPFTIKAGPRELHFTGREYLLHFALPNFYFHCTTAYGILRHNGLDIGKRDFMRRMPPA